VKSLISVILVSVLTVSCSTTIDFKTTGNRYHSPESSGDTLNGKFQFGYGKTLKYETATLFADSIFDNSVTKNTDGSIKESYALNIDLFVGIVEELDFYIRTVSDSAMLYGLKYQVIGDNEKEGHKLAILAAYGSGEETETDQRVTAQSTERVYKADLSIDAWEAELIYGYRFHKNILSYINFSFSNFDTKTSLTSPSFADEVIDVTARTTSLLLGVDLRSDNKKSGFVIESGVVKGEWDNRFDETYIPVGANFYVNWD